MSGDGLIYVTGFSSGSLNAQAYQGRQRCYYHLLSANIFITGGLYDIFLIKFNSTGSVLWTSEQGTSGDDRGYGVAVNGDGFIFVAGVVAGSINGQAYQGR